MENIFDSIDPIAWFTTTNGIIADLKPVIVLLLGFLVAFFILDYIVSMFNKVTKTRERFEGYERKREQEREEIDEFFDDDFPY